MKKDLVQQPLRISKLFPCCFYGYVILVAATVGKILSGPGQSPCVGVVIGEITEDLGLSLTVVTGLYFMATTTSAISLTYMGKIIDTNGVQVMVVIISIGLGVGCISLSHVGSTYFPILVISLYLSFLLLRFFGQGSLMMVSKTCINYWFVELRGTMMGIAGATVSLGMNGIFPIILNNASDTIGWRTLYERLGWVIILFMAPFGYIFYRHQPEHYGLLPDGKIAADMSSKGIYGGSSTREGEEEEMGIDSMGINGSKEQPQEQEQQQRQEEAEIQCVEQEMSAKEAFVTEKFWSNSIGVAIIGLSGATFWFHLKKITQDFHGVENSHSLLNNLYPVIAISNLMGRLLSGTMIDYLRPKKLEYLVLCGCLVLQTITMLIVPTLSIHVAFLYLFCILQGLADSTAMNVSSTVFANSFGRKELNEIQGRADALIVFGSAVGPFPYGYVRDVTGSYQPAFLVGSIFPLLLMFWVYHSNTPKQRRGGEGKYATLINSNQEEDNDDGDDGDVHIEESKMGDVHIEDYDRDNHNKKENDDGDGDNADIINGNNSTIVILDDHDHFRCHLQDTFTTSSGDGDSNEDIGEEIELGIAHVL